MSRDAKGQFGKGATGNPAGRPRKPKRLAVPSQMRKDFLTVADLEVTINTPNGPENMPIGVAIILSIATNALKGKATATREWMKYQCMFLQERLEAYRSIQVVDALQHIAEEPASSYNPVDPKMLNGMIEAVKKRY